ncbi:MAG: hypothetical protein KAS12_02425, partial [Candidatus Aenigmarchaeota archaeon]|nr:hypothetical protein [Candidatus Aenigmarchaeota archaeon]
AILMYVFFMILAIIPQHLQSTEENILEAKAWDATQNLIDYLSIKKDINMNESALNRISKCSTYNANPNDVIAKYSVLNYTDIQNNILNMSSIKNFHIQIDQYVIALITKKNILNFTGVAVVAGKEIFFETIYNTINMQHDSVVVDNGTTKVIVNTNTNNNIVYLDSIKYTVDKIDINGQFVILKTNIVDCGRQSNLNARITTHKRYLKRNNDILGIMLTYW